MNNIHMAKNTFSTAVKTLGTQTSRLHCVWITTLLKNDYITRL